MRRLSYDDIKENIEKEGYKLITNSKEYKNTKSKIKAICPNGNEWIFKYNYFQQGQRCGCDKCCPSNKKLSYDYVKNYIEDFGYKLISKEYKNNHTKLDILCPTCGEIFKCHFNNFQQGSRCPNCQPISKGELKIKEYLDDKNIEYIQEKIFPECKDKRFLRYDFYLPKYNLCIEYNGTQHYKKKFRMSDEDMDDRIKKDKIKEQFCIDNNIDLLIIPYWDFKNIEFILNSKLNYE